MQKLSIVSALAGLLTGHACALPEFLAGEAEKSPLSNFFIQPQRIVWTSEKGVANADALLKPHPGQAVLKDAGISLDSDPRRVAKSGSAQDAAQMAAVEIAATGAAMPPRAEPATTPQQG